MTRAEVAEELMKDDDVDAVLNGLVEFLHRKKEMKCEELKSPVEEGKQMNENENVNASQEREKRSVKKAKKIIITIRGRGKK